MPFRVEHGSIRDISALAQKSGAAKRQAEQQDQATQFSFQRALQTQNMQNQMRLLAYRQELDTQASKMSYEWELQKAMLASQATFQREQYKQNALFERDLLKSLRDKEDLQNKIDALGRAKEDGWINENEYQSKLIELQTGLQDRTRTTTTTKIPFSATLPKVSVSGQTSMSQLEAGVEPWTSELGALGTRGYEAKKAWQEHGIFTKVPTAGWKLLFGGKKATPEEAQQAYLSWRDELGYEALSDVDRKRVDALWDRKMKQEGLDKVWNPSSPEIQSLRETPVSTGQALTPEMAQEIFQEAGGDPKLAEQLALLRGYKF